MQPYLTPTGPFECEEEIKHSRFIASLNHCPDLDSAQAWIQLQRQQHPKANHHCWAYIWGAPTQQHSYGSSDDGEPAGSAGRPMLNVLQHSGIGHICIVISRYFGGTKLGVGGLVRAYGGLTQSALKELPCHTLTPTEALDCRCGYSEHAQLVRMLPTWQAKIHSEHFAAEVSFVLEVPPQQVPALTQQLSLWQVAFQSRLPG
ncbi:YigZ family protein [Balneatrix alpica]|uniref:YigZ family protein n=1 Tax=Balneatrix alpica TaxID=75684 RepID=UPI002738D4D2|nr:YigZ family protein [Balneatrix alpica]